LLNKLIIKKD